MQPGETAPEEWVAVHGISQHSAGYSEAWRNAMQDQITKDLHPNEVLWSQHVNAATRSLVDEDDAMALAAYRAQLAQELEERKEKAFVAAGGTGTAPATRWVMDSCFAS